MLYGISNRGLPAINTTTKNFGSGWQQISIQSEKLAKAGKYVLIE
jgi:hypothetical protein